MQNEEAKGQMLAHAKDHWKGIIQITKKKIKKEEDLIEQNLKRQVELDRKNQMKKKGVC